MVSSGPDASRVVRAVLPWETAPRGLRKGQGLPSTGESIQAGGTAYAKAQESQLSRRATRSVSPAPRGLPPGQGHSDPVLLTPASAQRLPLEQSLPGAPSLVSVLLGSVTSLLVCGVRPLRFSPSWALMSCVTLGRF